MEETPQIGNSGGATSSSIMETPQTETYEGQRILEETLAAEDREIRIRDDRREERLRTEQNQVQPRQLEQQTPALNQTPRSPGPGQQKKIEIAFTQPCCRLDERDITPKLVQEFRHQARHNPTLVTADVVTGDARAIITFHLLGDNSQPWMLPANRTSWWEYVNIEQAAEIVARYFQQQQHESAIPIAEQLHRKELTFNLADPSIENTCFMEFLSMIKGHFDTHAKENEYTMNILARTIEQKLPTNSQLAADYFSLKAIELGENGLDEPEKVIYRMKVVFGIVREKKRDVDKYGRYDWRYCSGIQPNTQTTPSTNLERGPTTISTHMERGTPVTPCFTCGIPGHSRATCYHTTAPEANHSSAPWGE